MQRIMENEGSRETIAAQAVAPYSFQDLLDRNVEKQGLDLAFHVHVPKASGGTVTMLFRQNNFQVINFDMARNEFFESLSDERRLLDAYLVPAPRRHSHLLSGHFRLDHPIFRRIGVRHFIVTTLRDPIDRMLSSYNYALRVPGNLWHEEVASGAMSFIEHAARVYAAVGPQYSFFDDTGRGSFAPSGTATPQECLNNLLSKVTFYGLTDRFNEFSLLFGYLVGRPRILAVPRSNVTISINKPIGIPAKETVTPSERDELSKLLKDDIWFFQEAVKEYDKRLSEPRLSTMFERVLPMARYCDEAMCAVMAMIDPADLTRRAFSRPK